MPQVAVATSCDATVDGMEVATEVCSGAAPQFRAMNLQLLRYEAMVSDTNAVRNV